MDLYPLNILSSYSFLLSGIKLNDFCAELKKRNISHLALADKDVMLGYPELYENCKKHCISPLFGSRFIVEGNELSVFILNETGYKNLIFLSQYISQNGCQNLTLSLLKEKCAGFAAILSSTSPIFENFDEHQLAVYLAKLDSMFNSNFYVGIEAYEKGDRQVSKIRDFLKVHPFKSLAFPKIRYIKKDEAIKLKILDAIKGRYHLDFDNEELKIQGPYYYKSTKEYEELYTPSEILETHKIFSLAAFDFVKKRGNLLKFSTTEDSFTLLSNLVNSRLTKLGLNDNKDYVDRLKEELSVIHNMGFDDYFLLVYDIVNYAKNNNILVGPGRGSAAGSLVAYLLNITEVDPLKYDLLFERFLNKDRVSMPDIDIDVEDTKRNQIISYLVDKYGIDRVAQIVTISEIKARQAIRDIGSIYDLNPIDIKKISKLLTGKDMTLLESFKKLPALKEFILDDPYYQKIYSLASKIEGLYRSRSLHAAGIVINDSSLFEKLPIIYDEGIKMNVSQLQKDDLEKHGFLKMDLLSLTNLSTIHLILDLIKKNHGKDIKFEEIPIDDKEIYPNIINKGLNTGLFQIESEGMQNAIRIIKPNCFDDIVALLAIFRPGPMDQIEAYAKNKFANKGVYSKDKHLQEILAPTYGNIVYQEQIMQIAQRIAGFSLSGADTFRKAISKKNAAELNNLRLSFINGCLKNGYSENFATRLYNHIYKFADYGFNKSHSVAYSMITVRMAWLKYYYPQEFYIALLSNAGTASDANTLNEFKKLNIKIAPPSINKSTRIFIAENDQMIMPFDAIKGLANDSIINILACRQRYKSFSSLFDFVKKMQEFKIPEKQLEKLILAGCFDEFGVNRDQLMDKIPTIIRTAQIFSKSSSLLIFNDEEISYDETIKEDKVKRAFNELELLGAMITVNPLKALKENYKDTKFDIFDDFNNNGYYNFIAIVSKVKIIRTKKEKTMAFLSLFDENGDTIEGIAFPETYEKYHDLIDENKIVIVSGKCEKTLEKTSILISELKEVKYE